jgi:hypothetical protein
MAKTPTDRYIELLTVVTTVEERVNHWDRRLTDLNLDHKSGSQSLNDLCKDFALQLSHLKRDIEDLKKWKDDLGKESEERKRRWWAFGPNVTAAILTILLAPLTVLLWNYLSSLFKSP